MEPESQIFNETQVNILKHNVEEKAFLNIKYSLQ